MSATLAVTPGTTLYIYVGEQGKAGQFASGFAGATRAFNGGGLIDGYNFDGTGNRVMTSPDAVAVLPAVSIAANPSGSITAGTSVTFTATPPTAALRQVINGKKAAPTLAPTAPPTWALRELILPTAISSPAS